MSTLTRMPVIFTEFSAVNGTKVFTIYHTIPTKSPKFTRNNSFSYSFSSWRVRDRWSAKY